MNRHEERGAQRLNMHERRGMDTGGTNQGGVGDHTGGKHAGPGSEILNMNE